MDTLPLELLTAVATALLSTADSYNFRLVCRRFACAGFPVLFRHVSVLNTTDCLKQFQTMRDSPYGSLGATKNLTIYDGTWPLVDRRSIWNRHPLLMARSWADPQLHPGPAQDAYRQYTQFIAQEIRREPPDVHLIDLLQSFPTLRSISVSHVNRWNLGPLDLAHYNNLISTIWILPYWETFIAKTVLSLLQIINSFPHIRRLDISGSLKLESVGHGVYPAIQYLEVKSLVGRKILKTKAREFLASFPNLRSLSVSLERGGPLGEQVLPLDGLQWHKLRFCSLYNLWISEDELFGFIKRHSSQLWFLTLNQITLVDGSWESFFFRYRELPDRPMIEDNGVSLSALGSPGCVLNPDSFRLFLSQKGFPWPFGDPEPSDSIFHLELPPPVL
ncbi:hypothetical protein B0T19DRAFT_355422 [Cercophora scortea]|uniref:F-box domain-containing protein n=1 Tax=Cercophora scortea TaxID=314031 RepID=A0AAE0IWL9_9PEZI|nr:hypothetical protein B0T19DRAFT_355422 [Cercophora scortea]